MQSTQTEAELTSQLQNINQLLSSAQRTSTSLTSEKNTLARSLAAAKNEAEAARKDVTQANSLRAAMENQLQMATTKHEAKMRQSEGEKHSVAAQLEKAHKSHQLEVGELSRRIDQVS